MDNWEKSMKEPKVPDQESPPQGLARIVGEAANVLEESDTVRLLNEILAQSKITLLDGNEVMDLSEVPEKALADDDPVWRGKIAYALAYLKLCEFLRLKPSPSVSSESQAKVALAFIRHAETTNSPFTRRIGGQADAHLERTVTELRSEVVRLVQVRERRRKEREKLQGNTVVVDVVPE